MTDRRLIVVFLRGGADGLSLVPPVGDPSYYDARPTIAVPEPGNPDGALPLTDRFGLHPAMAALMPLYAAGDLAILHAVGSDDTTRSHFDAQDRMERACTEADGWIARHLRTRPGDPPGGLSAVALSPALPLAMMGAPATALGSLSDLPGLGDERYRRALTALWHPDARPDDVPAPLADAGTRALEVGERLRAMADEPVTTLPDTAFGRALADVVRLVRADVGLEVAHIDFGNWDTHFVQTSLIPERAKTLADGLAGLPAALGTAWANTTVVVMTEFGRRIIENTSLGTDHGRGSAAFVLGGAVRGGQVLADWPGLRGVDPDVRDLRVTLDFRHLLADVVGWLGNRRIADVFPAFELRPTGLLD